jgi:hypothetical protein
MSFIINKHLLVLAELKTKCIKIATYSQGGVLLCENQYQRSVYAVAPPAPVACTTRSACVRPAAVASESRQRKAQADCGVPRLRSHSCSPSFGSLQATRWTLDSVD